MAAPMMARPTQGASQWMGGLPVQARLWRCASSRRSKLTVPIRLAQ